MIWNVCQQKSDKPTKKLIVSRLIQKSGVFLPDRLDGQAPHKNTNRAKNRSFVDSVIA